jgi:hypothetical protein
MHVWGRGMPRAYGNVVPPYRQNHIRLARTLYLHIALLTTSP